MSLWSFARHAVHGGSIRRIGGVLAAVVLVAACAAGLAAAGGDPAAEPADAEAAVIRILSDDTHSEEPSRSSPVRQVNAEVLILGVSHIEGSSTGRAEPAEYRQAVQPPREDAPRGGLAPVARLSLVSGSGRAEATSPTPGRARLPVVVQPAPVVVRSEKPAQREEKEEDLVRAAGTVEKREPSPPTPIRLTLRELTADAARAPHQAEPAGFAEASHATVEPATPATLARPAPALKLVVGDKAFPQPTPAPPRATAQAKPVSPPPEPSQRREAAPTHKVAEPARLVFARQPAEDPETESRNPGPKEPKPQTPQRPGRVGGPSGLATSAERSPAAPVEANRDRLPPRRPAAAGFASATRPAPRGAQAPESPRPATISSMHAVVMPGDADSQPIQIPTSEVSSPARSQAVTPAPTPAPPSVSQPAIPRVAADAAPAPATPQPSERMAWLQNAQAKPELPPLPKPVAEKPAERPRIPAEPSVPDASRPPRVPSPAPHSERPLVDTRPRSVDTLRPTAQITQLGPFEVRSHVEEMKVFLRRSKLLRTKVDIYRVSVVEPSICDVVQYTPREISIVGKSQGATDVTFWFADERHEPLTFLVRVVPDPEVQERREEQYAILEDVLAELFPESKVKLIPVADKLIVRGQARCAEEAAQIMTVIRGQAVYPGRGAGYGHPHGGGYGLVQGQAADPLGQEDGLGLPASNVINMLHIPGVQQVALKVKVAELNRTAAREFGVDMDMRFVWNEGAIAIRSLLSLVQGNSGVISGTFDNERINFGIHYLEQHGVVRLLSEPTLVTLSGRPATFLAGGEFAVPTTVGVSGAAAVTTDFRAFGAIVTFLPVVLDKDLIRLEVAPEFSQLNEDNSVNGTPGLDTRAVTTTVEMREGQTLAIAGLLDDTMTGNNTGDIPIVARIFGRREMTRNETELLILVTPELVHPMEPEAVPPLPGFDVTEPTNCEFFLQGRIEGRPTHEYRSTVWPRLRRRYQAGGPAMISGPFGHGD